MSEENKAVVRRYIDEAFKRRNLSALETLLSPDYVWHGPGGQEVRGVEGAKAMVRGYHTAFPDLQLTTDDLLADGDKVVTRWTATGTHQGELMGIAPTGKRVTVGGIVVTRLKDGKMVEDWEQFDRLSLLQQIGAVPA